MAKTRSKADIEAEINAARSRLASNVQGLITQAHPKAVATRAKNDVKDFAAHEVNAATSHVLDDDGRPKWDRIAYLAVAVIGSLAFAAVFKSIFR